MIEYGGPRICGACRTLAHAPSPSCPAPYLADPDAEHDLDEFERLRAERGLA